MTDCLFVSSNGGTSHNVRAKPTVKTDTIILSALRRETQTSGSLIVNQCSTLSCAQQPQSYEENRLMTKHGRPLLQILKYPIQWIPQFILRPYIYLLGLT